MEAWEKAENITGEPKTGEAYESSDVSSGDEKDETEVALVEEEEIKENSDEQ